MKGEKSKKTQPSQTSIGKLGKLRTEKKTFHREEHTNYFVWCQMVCSGIIWTEQIIFENMYVYSYTYMHTLIFVLKYVINLKYIREIYLERFGREKGKREVS